MKGLLIITGEQGSGKSEMIKAICKGLREKGKRVAGIYARGMWKDNERSGFVLKSLLSGESLVLCENRFQPGWMQFRRFWFNPEAFAKGNIWLKDAILSNSNVIILDEIGPLEIEGKGWAENLTGFFSQSEKKLLIVSIRPSLISKIVADFKLKPIRIIETTENIELILNEISHLSDLPESADENS